jgi:hypothetical protein
MIACLSIVISKLFTTVPEDPERGAHTSPTISPPKHQEPITFTTLCCCGSITKSFVVGYECTEQDVFHHHVDILSNPLTSIERLEFDVPYWNPSPASTKSGGNFVRFNGN